LQLRQSCGNTPAVFFCLDSQEPQSPFRMCKLVNNRNVATSQRNMINEKETGVVEKCKRDSHGVVTELNQATAVI
jgi:hypothetical protein